LASTIGGNSDSAAGVACPPGETSRDPWWTVAAFRAYAAHTRTLGRHRRQRRSSRILLSGG
jgi:hypothetical protein